MKTRNLRRVQRSVHLVAGVLLIAYFYGPLRGSAALETLITGGAIPAVGISGMAMWQGPRLRRLRRSIAARRVEERAVA